MAAHRTVFIFKYILVVQMSEIYNIQTFCIITYGFFSACLIKAYLLNID